MINKFQQGGKQLDAVMQFVLGMAEVLQAEPEQVAQLAQQNPEAFKAAVQVYQLTKDIKLAAQTFAQAFLKLAQAARHGAKLNYIRSLKNLCPEGEETFYYKKGGSVKCGCKKKEDGGKVVPLKKDSPVARFKSNFRK